MTIEKKALVVVVPAMAIVLGGVFWWWDQAESECVSVANTEALKAAALAAVALERAQTEQLVASKELDRMRDAVEAARTTGDATKLKDAQDTVRRAEVIVRERATVTARREAEAAILRHRATDVGKSSSTARLAGQRCSG